MPFQVLFPWTNIVRKTNVHTNMRLRSKMVRDAITKQWWYVELDSCGKDKTAIRLCLVPSDDMEMVVNMKFSLYLKKDDTVLAMTTNVSRFSRSKPTSEVYLMSMKFKDINDDVKLSMIFDNPTFMSDQLMNDSASCHNNETHSPILGHNQWPDNQAHALMIGDNNASFLSFLKTGEFCDVIITVKGQEIKCHKLLLCYNSPYFSEMFKSSLNENIENKIDIVDFDYETINAMINYLYASYLPKIPLELAKKLQVAADKYQMPGLKYICEQQLISEITMQNAMDILLYADIYSAETVKARTIKFILSNWEDFKDKEHYEALMTRPDLLRDLMIAKANDDSESRVRRSQTNSESVSPLLID